MTIKVTRPVAFPCFGVLKKEKYVLLPSVADIVIEQGYLQSCFGVYSVRIENAGVKRPPSDDLQIQGITNPSAFRKAVLTHLSNIRTEALSKQVSTVEGAPTLTSVHPQVAGMFREASSSSDHSRTRESTSGQLSSDQQMGASHHQGLVAGNEDDSICSRIGFSANGMNLNAARIILAEGLGTFILVFSICGIMGSMQLLGNQVGLLEYAITAGTAIVVIIFTLGEISGAHVNPAVTIAFAVFGHFPWKKVPFYVIAQLLGSILATYLGELVFRVKPELIMTVPIKGHAVAAFSAELIATFFVTFLAASLARDAKSVGNLAGFVMGIAIALAVLITGPLSGGSLNPARSLGPAIIAWKLDQFWIYIVAPVFGAILGVLMVHALCLHKSTQSDHHISAARSVLP